ncbi:type IV toxin-antitoxin system AbiEi family antitoxin [Rhodococcus sp. 14-1411-2a]|uniref:type IV toxin-antitoxin system AbiEi family antitoxin n=2 Tax=Mycobacteriales TaxID=85007 RepID=UPI00117B79DD|nr:type IV toxin-antitoxin system AbiEi family antitoxin [Rhodococcus sp. 14-1411-2a]
MAEPPDRTRAPRHVDRPTIASLRLHGLLADSANFGEVCRRQPRCPARMDAWLGAAAAGIAVSAYGRDDAVVMGVSAARLHGAIPRALATAVVAVPTRHDPIRLADREAVIRFVVRDMARLDAERIDTELGAVLVTTAKQTVFDLAMCPGLGDA